MRAFIAALLVVICGYAVTGQEAQVLELSTSDAVVSKLKYETLQAAQKDWDGWNQSIADRYTKLGKTTCPSGGAVFYYNGGSTQWSGCESTKEGWYNGFTYSKDFKFIVPKITPPLTQNNGIILTPVWNPN